MKPISRNQIWITITEYVDLETGELISKSKFLREYYEIDKSYKIETNGTKTIKRYTTRCRPNRQLKLF